MDSLSSSNSSTSVRGIQQSTSQGHSYLHGYDRSKCRLPDEGRGYRNDDGNEDRNVQLPQNVEMRQELDRVESQSSRKRRQGSRGGDERHEQTIENEETRRLTLQQTFEDIMEEAEQRLEQKFQEKSQQIFDEGFQERLWRKIDRKIDRELEQVFERGLQLGTKPELERKSNLADMWLRRVEEMTLVLRCKEYMDAYKAVKVAILDTGIDPESWYRKRIKGYRDFIDKDNQIGFDKTGHGTDMVHLIFKIIPNVHIFVARIWEADEGNDDTPELMAKAILYATEDWKVDIITIASGFEHDFDPVENAICDAIKNKILIFAAASNYGENSDIAFPARLHGKVMCMFSSDGGGEPSKSFNPSPSKLSENFCILGEGLDASNPMRPRRSGTSFATSIGAAIAALVIDFCRHPDGKEIIGNMGDLQRVRGMSAVFRSMVRSVESGRHNCVYPWNLLKGLDREMGNWGRAKQRQHVFRQIANALRQGNF